MTDKQAMIGAILANPDEDTPRLAFADMLEEQGEYARAQYIRESIEYDAWYDPHEPAPRAIDARARLAELMEEWFPSHWPIPPMDDARQPYTFLKDSLGAVVHGDPKKPGHRATFSRGFCTLLVVSGQDWGRYAKPILRNHPVKKVIFTSWPLGEPPLMDPAWRYARIGPAMLEKLAEQWPDIEFTLPSLPRSWREARREARDDKQL